MYHYRGKNVLFSVIMYTCQKNVARRFLDDDFICRRQSALLSARRHIDAEGKYVNRDVNIEAKKPVPIS